VLQVFLTSGYCSLQQRILAKVIWECMGTVLTLLLFLAIGCAVYFTLKKLKRQKMLIKRLRDALAQCSKQEKARSRKTGKKILGGLARKSE
jgi:hypothetical protein